MDRLSVFYPAIVVFFGAFLVAIGTFWASSRQSNFNAELKQKNEIISELQLHSANMITGGDSFAYLTPVSTSVGAQTTGIAVIHQGKYPLYDVSIRVYDIEAAKAKNLGGIPDVSQLNGNVSNIGNLSPGLAYTLPEGLKLPADGRLNLNLFFTARNGAWSERLRTRFVEGNLEVAVRVTRDDAGDFAFEQISNKFPRDASGQVDWENEAAAPSAIETDKNKTSPQ